MKLSIRMEAVAGLVGTCKTVCDVGCDHGYLPIYLVKEKKAERAIAMDVNQGPLNAANANIAAYEMSDRIETRLSDGLAALKKGEADTVVVAGMGGRLIIKIISDSIDKIKDPGFGIKNLILQPQSELEYFRRQMKDFGFRSEAESMVIDDGKYYPMTRYVLGEDNSDDRVFFLYGEHLLKEKNSVLKEFLLKEEKNYLKVMDSLAKVKDEEKLNERRSEVALHLSLNKEAQAYFS